MVLLTITHDRPIANMGDMEAGLWLNLPSLSWRRHGGGHAKGGTQGVGGLDFWCQKSPLHLCVLGVASWMEDSH